MNTSSPAPIRRRLGPGAGARRALAFAAITTLAVGCGRGSDFAQVHGVVTMDGKPLERGKVVFVPSSGPGAEGQIQPDGTFRLQTRDQGDGALIGHHRVAVMAFQEAVWPPPYDAKDGAQDTGLLVPPRYGSIDSSGISCDVKPGDNAFPIELKSK